MKHPTLIVLISLFFSTVPMTAQQPPGGSGGHFPGCQTGCDGLGIGDTSSSPICLSECVHCCVAAAIWIDFCDDRCVEEHGLNGAGLASCYTNVCDAAYAEQWSACISEFNNCVHCSHLGLSPAVGRTADAVTGNVGTIRITLVPTGTDGWFWIGAAWVDSSREGDPGYADLKAEIPDIEVVWVPLGGEGDDPSPAVRSLTLDRLAR